MLTGTSTNDIDLVLSTQAKITPDYLLSVIIPGVKVEILYHLVDLSNGHFIGYMWEEGWGRPVDFPDFSFNRFLGRPDGEGNFYFYDPCHGYEDLFPEFGSSKGRLIGNLAYYNNTEEQLRFFKRFLHFAISLDLEIENETLIKIFSFIHKNNLIVHLDSKEKDYFARMRRSFEEGTKENSQLWQQL